MSDPIVINTQNIVVSVPHGIYIFPKFSTRLEGRIDSSGPVTGVKLFTDNIVNGLQEGVVFGPDDFTDLSTMDEVEALFKEALKSPAGTTYATILASLTS